MKNKLLVIILMAVCNSTAFSFGTHEDSLRDIYIESFHDRFYIKLLSTLRNHSLDIQSKKDGLELNYRPNGNIYLGIGAYVFDLGIETSLRLAQNAKNTYRYGETDFFDLQTNLYGKSWGADFSVQRYNGFYVANPVEHYPNWNRSEPYPKRDDLTVNSFSANIFFMANNKRFSYRSAYNQADRLKTSSGSFIIGLNYINKEITGDTSFIPADSQAQFDIKNISYVGYSAVGIMPGYTYTFVMDYFYINLSGTLGPSLAFGVYNEDGVVLRKDQLAPIVLVRAAFGYNSPRWFTGITVVNHSSGLNTDKIEISGDSGNIKFFIGYRFKEVGFLKKDLF